MTGRKFVEAMDARLEECSERVLSLSVHAFRLAAAALMLPPYLRTAE